MADTKKGLIIWCRTDRVQPVYSLARRTLTVAPLVLHDDGESGWDDERLSNRTG